MERMVFTKVKQRTKQATVVDLLRHAIISGDIGPGERLTESTIAEQMAVSRAPLREALRQLEQEGLVVRIDNRGCSVTDFSDQDVVEIFSLRATLECMSIRWAAANLSGGDFADLRASIDAARGAIEKHDTDELTDLDMQFHEYICGKAHHGRLLKAWQSNNAQARMLLNSRFRHFSDYTPETVLDHHTQILSALEQGDTDKAIALTERISSNVARECIQLLHSKRNGAT